MPALSKDLIQNLSPPPLPLGTYQADSAASFAEAVDAIASKGPGQYTIIITGDFETNNIRFMGRNGEAVITIQGDASRRTITNSKGGKNDPVFITVFSGVTLKLGNNLTVTPVNDNGEVFNQRIEVNSGGKIEFLDGVMFGSNSRGYTMRTGISGAGVISGGVIGYVEVSDGGNLTMSGGKANSVNVYDKTGNNWTFTLSGGVINRVYVGENGTFLMKGGSVSGGGGVHIQYGIFTMAGGAISGNASGNRGGGVYVGIGGRFIKTSGTVRNNNADFGKEVFVQFCDDYTSFRLRNSPAGPEVNIASALAGTAGGCE